MRFPEELRQQLAVRYVRQRRRWLRGDGTWPLESSLHCPSEEDAQLQPEVLRQWISAWESWNGVGELVWCEKRWRVLGLQRLPERMLLANADQVATLLGEQDRWRRVCVAYECFVGRWPVLKLTLPRYFDVLAAYDASDLERLEGVLAWIERNPKSGLYSRQLPIAGIDTKWLEDKRGLICDLMAAITGMHSARADLYEICGLKPPPFLLRLAILDSGLRERVGGLSDVTAPVDELAAIAFRPEVIYIVENLQTGLAFDDVAGGVVIMGLGNNISSVARLLWLTEARSIVYWGDIDTHGFSILSSLRALIPQAVSVLMDEGTMFAHRPLWTREARQFAAADLPHLTPLERVVYQHLKRQTWGMNVRLEQERIGWDHVWPALQRAVNQFT